MEITLTLTILGKFGKFIELVCFYYYFKQIYILCKTLKFKMWRGIVWCRSGEMIKMWRSMPTLPPPSPHNVDIRSDFCTAVKSACFLELEEIWHNCK